MVLKELSENIEENPYYSKYKYDESAEKVSVHLRISPKIANELVKIIAIYRDFKIDKYELTKSDLGAVIFKEYFDEFGDDESAILNLFSKIKAFRDGGAANGES